MSATHSGFIALIGRPNAGKSTLLNRVLGSELSIVSSKPQTTRDRVLGILTDRKFGQIVFVDTPGIHRAREGGINAAMVREAEGALEAPHLVWYLVDPHSERYHEEEVLRLLRKSTAPFLIVLNKADLWGKKFVEGTLPPWLTEWERELRATFGERFQGMVRISARKGAGIETLIQKSKTYIPEGPWFYPDADQLSDKPTRFFVAEKVREQLFLQLGEELPYSCAVQVDQFEEDAKPPRIEATIHVERDSQKGMVIGKGGAKIKSIGQAARRGVEKFLGESVFLGLRVKVLKDWTRDAEALRALGYVLPEERESRL